MFNTNVINNIKESSSNNEKTFILSSHFNSNYSANELYRNGSLIGISSKVGKIFGIAFGIDSSITTIDLANAWLSENPVTVYYELEEPQTITLNGTYDIQLFDGINNITTNDELQPNMIVTAYRNGINGRFYDLQKNQEQLEEDINNINNSMAGLNANVDVAMNMASRAEMHATDNEYELAELKDTVNQKMQSDYDSLPVGSVIDYDGEEVPTGYEKVSNDMKILWTNPNPTSEFAEQDITLNSDDYDVLEIYYLMAANNTYVGSQKIPKGYNTRLMYTTSSLMIRFRNIIYLSDTSYSIESGAGASGSDSDLIPLYIIGYKTGLFS